MILVTAKINDKQVKYRLCGDKDDTIDHIISKGGLQVPR